MDLGIAGQKRLEKHGKGSCPPAVDMNRLMMVVMTIINGLVS